MKKLKMNKEAGITLIALIITIIVLTIIASVATYSGVDALRQSKEETQLAEVGMVQQAILENYTKYKMVKNEKYIVGTAITNYGEVENIVKEINNKASKNIYLKVPSKYYEYLNEPTSDKFDKSYYYYELNKNDLETLGIKQEEDTFIVNYVTGEVINKDLLVTGRGNPLYIYSVELPNIDLP